MQRYPVSIIISVFLSIICPVIGLSAEPARQDLLAGKTSFTIGTDIGSLTGFTLYRIKFPVEESVNGFFVTDGESKLEFPLDSSIGNINTSLGQDGVWSIDLSISKNLTTDTGKIKDSDWVTARHLSTGEIERALIIYSESDTDMDALFVDINARYYFLRKANTSLGFIGGYRYQNLSFDISNLDQIDATDHVFVPGKIATYEVTYNIPYGGIAFDIKTTTRFSLNLSGGYGWAFAKDEDDHILRSKRSTGEADGPFYFLKAQSNLSIIQSLSLQMTIEYLKIDTDGTQDQIWYATTKEAKAGTTINDIAYSAESEQLYLWAGIRYIF